METRPLDAYVQYAPFNATTSSGDSRPNRCCVRAAFAATATTLTLGDLAWSDDESLDTVIAPDAWEPCTERLAGSLVDDPAEPAANALAVPILNFERGPS